MNKKRTVKINSLEDVLMEYSRYNLPCISIPDSAYRAYKKAMKIDMHLDESESKESVIVMIHAYWDAFMEGFDVAGVNLLHHLYITKINAKIGDGDAGALQDKYMTLIDMLQENGHPAGDYYHALTLITGIIDNDRTETENLEEGYMEMRELADAGNPYAIAFFKVAEE